MSPNLYDLLDVDETASSDEIRAAWKSAIADLDPTDRRFRAYNDAATVLLDDDKRAAYDAELAAARADGEAEEPEEVAVEPTPAPEAEPVPAPEDVQDVQDGIAEDEGDAPPVAAGPGRAPATWALLAAGVVAVLSVVLLVYVLTLPGSTGPDSPADREERAEDATTSVEDAAAQIVPIVLSYDYRTLDADLDRARPYLTDEFAKQRTDLFSDIREQVVKEQVVVTSAVPGTGLTRVSEGGERATVVVYVNQDSQKGKAEPRPLRMWATLTLLRDGDDWVLDDICTEDDCF